MNAVTGGPGQTTIPYALRRAWRVLSVMIVGVLLDELARNLPELGSPDPTDDEKL